MFNKVIVFLFLSFWELNASYAQNDTEHYLFSEFSDAIIVYKTGLKKSIGLNYNTVTEEMVFFENGQYLALDMTETIDTIYINSSTFIPYKNYFLEQHSTDPARIFVRHKHTLLNVGKSTGYGTSQTNAIDNYSSVISSGQIYELNISGDFQLMPENSFFVVIENEIKSVNNIREISKLFSFPKHEIRSYLKSENLDLKNIHDLNKLIVFLKNN